MAVESGREARPVPRTNVAVVSDDRLFAEGLLRLVDAVPAFEVVDYRAVDERRPHVLLVDSRVDRALELCGTVAREDRIFALLVATSDDDAFACDALASGARGVLPKSASGEDLINAIRVVAAGEFWARRRVLATVIERLSGVTPPPPPQIALEKQLSDREREVFRHAATGLGNKELAGRLAISESTVKVHLTHIFQKLGVSGRAELVAAFHGTRTARRSVRTG